MQHNKTTNQGVITDVSKVPKKGRLLALDPGSKRIGVAVCDELQISVRRIGNIKRASWKKILADTISILADLDAVALIVGLPLNSDGSESEMSTLARRFARNYSLSLEIPVLLHDERVTTYQAKRNLWDAGKSEKTVREIIDAESAAVILEDFLSISR